jgi:Fur family ferric uptake transcriptional regulator
MNDPGRLLKNFKLRATPSRETILQLFLGQPYALSHGDIEQEMPSDFDRVTVYRTLKTFLDKGIIHKVLDDEGTMKYALCNEACSDTSHHHDHVHFKCTRCGHTQCLDQDVPAMRLPRGFKAVEVNILIQGVCEKCS